MQSARDSAPSPAVQSPGRRLLSRFASGLASKPRSTTDFNIQLDDEGRQYSTGDTIKGSVRFRVIRPVRITHIVVSLSGRAHVYKNPTSPAESHRIGGHNSNVGSKSTGQYHGNGLATLFEEEQVLCGDGRLAEGLYQFNFELDFPPDRELPSSVDFERGKIFYTITAAITRPTTISPVLTCERVVVFVEKIDISALYPPKPRTIILDPIAKRSKARSQALKLKDTNDRKSIKSNTKNEAQTGSETSFRTSVSTSQEIERPLSPVPSEMSQDSHVSSNGITSQHDSISVSASPTSSFVSRPTHSKSGQGIKTIGTTIESCNGGCLRGDHVVVKVTVNHSKYMKSMHGVIVTLYRHARVDTQPALSIGPLDKTKTEKQSYYPRSITGLGGLSLSGAGSAHIFRKDLTQSVYPLVINPSTLTAEITARVRVPEDVFPTISGLPGAMISFKYYIEVIVDIQGKLASPMNPLSELTSTNMTSTETYDVDYTSSTMHGSRVLDTTYVRRDKGVVCTSFEVVIGTIDSDRKKGKRRAVINEDTALDATLEVAPVSPVPLQPPTFDSVQTFGGPSNGLYRQHSGPNSTGHGAESSRSNGVYDYAAAHYPSPPPPIPHLPDESQMSEKERIRLAETRLLPSAPPGMDEAVNGYMPEASAPMLADERQDYDDHDDDYYEPAPQDEYSVMTSSFEPGPGPDGGVALDRWPTTQHIYTNGDGIQSNATAVLHEQGSQQPQSSAVVHLEASDSTAVTEHDGNETSNSNGVAVEAGQNVTTTPQHEPNISHANLHDSHAEASALSDLPRYER